MSSPESSGAPTESSATSQPAGEFAAAPSFGTTRGSGLARGKRPASSSPAATASAPASGYKPTAIEIVTAPREYQNPFAPANPEPAETSVEAAPAPVAAVIVNEAPVSTPVASSVAVETPSPAVLPEEEKAELNILPPERTRTVPAQTWESDGFKARPERSERPARQESPRYESPREENTGEETPADLDSIPSQFLYVRPGVEFVPTPRNWGGAPRERRQFADQPAAERASEASPAAAPAPAPEVKSSGGFFGWLKSLFGDSNDTGTVKSPVDDRSADRQRGGRGRNHSGQSYGGGGDRSGGGQRRHRGGRGRSNRGQRSGPPGGGGDGGAS